MATNNNQIIYFDQNVPDFYVNGSRDFQLLTRLLTFALNAGKVEADQLLYLNDALLTNNNLLPLLQTKVGFWSDFEFPDDAIRLVCDVFDLIVRRKGSRRGIVEAIEIYLRSLGISTDFDIFIQNVDPDGNFSYKIEIGINALWHDYTLLSEILRYIIPTGYILSIYFYDKIAFVDKSILYSDFVLLTAPENQIEGAKIRNWYYSSTTEQWKVLGARIVDANETIIFGEYVDGVFVPYDEMQLEGHPEDGTIVVKKGSKAPNKIYLTHRAENVDVPDYGAVCFLFSSDASGLYNGIQSIDLTRIYGAGDNKEHEEYLDKTRMEIDGEMQSSVDTPISTNVVVKPEKDIEEDTDEAVIYSIDPKAITPFIPIVSKDEIDEPDPIDPITPIDPDPIDPNPTI